MAYVTVAELRQVLTQVAATAENDALLTTLLTRAEQLVDGELGFSFTAYGATATARTVLSNGGTYLRLPYYQSGSLTEISLGGEVISADEYEADPETHLYLLRISDADAASLDTWPAGRYRVKAKWGTGDPPELLKQVVIEVAMDLWHTPDSGYAGGNIGLEGAPRAAHAFTWRQRDMLAAVRQTYLGGAVFA